MFNLSAVKNYIETKVIKGNTLSERKINELRTIIKEGACPAGPKGRLVNFRQKDDRNRNDAEKAEAAQIRTYLKDKLKEIQDLKTANQPKEAEKKEESTKAEIQLEIEFCPELEQEKAFQALLISGVNNLDHKSLSDNLQALKENGVIIYKGEEDNSIPIRNDPRRGELLEKVAKDTKSLIDKEKEAIKRLSKLGNRNLPAESSEREKYEYEAFLSYVTKAIKELDEETLVTDLENLKEGEISFLHEYKERWNSIIIKNNSNILSLLNSAIGNVQRIKSKKSQIIQEIQEASERNIVSINQAEALRFKEEQAFQDKTYVENLIKEYVMQLNHEGLASILERSRKAGELKYSEERRESLVIAFTPELKNLLEDSLKEIQEKIKTLEDLIEGKYPDGRIMPLDRRKELLQKAAAEGGFYKAGKVYITVIPGDWREKLKNKIEELKKEAEQVKNEIKESKENAENLKRQQKEQKRAVLQQAQKKEQRNSLLSEGPRAQTCAHQDGPNPWTISKLTPQENGSWLKGSDGSTERIPAIYKISPEATNSTTEEKLNKLAQLKQECEILTEQEKRRIVRDTELSKQLMPPYQLYPKSYVSKYNSCFPGVYTVLKGAENHLGPLEDQLEQYVRARHLLITIAEMMRIPRECIDLGQYRQELENQTWYKKLSEEYAQKIKLLNGSAVTTVAKAWNTEDFEIAKKNCNELKKLFQRIIELTLKGREEIRLMLEQEIEDLSKAIPQLQDAPLKQETTQATTLDRTTVDPTTKLILDQISKEIIEHEIFASNVQALPPAVLVPSDRLRTELTKKLIAKRKELQALKDLDAPEDLPLTNKAKQLLGIIVSNTEETMTASIGMSSFYDSHDDYKGQISCTNFGIPASKQIPVEFKDKKTKEIWDKLDSQYQQKLFHCSELRNQYEVLFEEEKQLSEKYSGRALPNAIHEHEQVLSAERNKICIEMNKFSESGLAVEDQIKTYTEIIKNLKEAIENWKLAKLIEKYQNLKNWSNELDHKLGVQFLSIALKQKAETIMNEIALSEKKAGDPLLKDIHKIFTELCRLYKESIEIKLEVTEEVILCLEKEITQLEINTRTIINALANENLLNPNDQISPDSFSRIQDRIKEESFTKPITLQPRLHEAISPGVLHKALNELTIEIAAKQKKLKELREINLPKDLVLNPKSYALISSITLTAVATAGPNSSLDAPKETAKMSKQQKHKKLAKLEKEFRTLYQAHETNQKQPHKLPIKLFDNYKSLNTTKTNKIKELESQKESSKKIEIYEVLINTLKKLIELEEVAELRQEEENLHTHVVKLSEEVKGLFPIDNLLPDLAALDTGLDKAHNPIFAKEFLLKLKNQYLKISELLLEARLELLRGCEKKIEGLTSSLELIESILKAPNSYEGITISALEEKLKDIAAAKDHTFTMFQIDTSMNLVSSETLLTESLLKMIAGSIEPHLEETNKELTKLKKVNVPQGVALTSKSYELINSINRINNTEYKEGEKEAISGPSSSLASASVNKLDEGLEKA